VSRVLIDTHVLLWWLADDPSLSPLARETIADPATTPLVSLKTCLTLAWPTTFSRVSGSSLPSMASFTWSINS